jgi:hypothetical protein
MAKELSFSLGIGATPLYEPEDSELASELFRIYQALNVLAAQLDASTGSLVASIVDRPYTLASSASKEVNLTRCYGEATVALTAGEVVRFNAAGKIIKAQSTTTHLLKGQMVVLESTLAGSYAPLAMRGVVRLYTGLTPGADYMLSTTAGAISVLAPAATNTLQYLGFAVSSSELYFEPEPRHSVV